MPFCTVPPEVIAPLTGLAGAALGAFLAHRYSRNRDHLELKRDVLRRFMGYRWHLRQGHSDPESPFFTALNEVPMVFAGDSEVENAVDDFRSVIAGGFLPEHVLPLAKAMAKSAKIPHKRWSENLLKQPFGPGS